MALIPRKGIPVFVRVASEEADQMVLSKLFMAHNGDKRQATIYLQFATYVYGIDQTQVFDLAYDANNLQPSEIDIKPESKALPLDQHQTLALARRGNCELYILSLSLKTHCAVKCPPYPRSFAPRRPADPCFRQLATLARQTKVQILLDYSWIEKDSRPQFTSFIRNIEHFTGFQREDKDAGRWRDWTVFSPTQETEAPPSYAEASNKRPRSLSPSSTLPGKRVLLSPFALSPTELATPSPPRPCSPTASSPNFHQAVETAMQAILPNVVETAMKAILPNVVETAMKAILPGIVETAVKEILPGGLEVAVTDAVDKAVEHIDYAGQLERNGLRDEVSDCAVEISLVKQDCIVELESLMDTKLDELKEESDEVINEIRDHITEVYVDFRDRTSQHLLHSSCNAVKVGKTAVDQKRRAASLPL